MKQMILLLIVTLGSQSLLADEHADILMHRIMNKADKNKDDKLSLEEYRTLDVQAHHHGEEHFKSGDTNHDNFIETSELTAALRKQTWFAILSEGAKPCFFRLDINNDRKLTADEYRKISRMGHHSLQHFNSADANKDGFLDMVEFANHAESKLKANDVGNRKHEAKKVFFMTRS